MRGKRIDICKMMTEKRKQQKNQRIEYIDALKGFAIFCVIWGHSLQNLKNSYDFFHNPIFEFIYSFHMPLFFMVSGFFFSSSLKLNFKDFLYKKSMQLLLPCVVWSIIIHCIMKFSAAIVYGDEYFFSNWHVELKSILFPTRWSWFLRELFISYFIVYVSLKLLKKDWLACLLSIGFVLIAPYCGFQRVFLPVFWAGIYLKDNYHFILKYAKQILIISGTIFTICLFFWDGNYTMYVTDFPKLLKISPLSFNFTNINISFFRLFIGLFGSLFWFMLFKNIYKNNNFFVCLRKVGANTLAIYLLQWLIFESWITIFLEYRKFDFPDMNIWIYSLILTPLISLVIFGICIVIIKIVQKNKYVELLLFGKI